MLPAPRAALDLYRTFDIERHDADLLLPRAWDVRDSLTAYDAAYVSLAEALGAPLVTTDRRMARAAQRYCEVIGAG